MLEYIAFIVLYILFLLFFILIVRVVGLSFLFRSSPWVSFIIYNYYIFSLPGVLAVYILGRSSIRYFNEDLANISVQVTNNVFYFYVMSLFIVLSFFYVAFSKSGVFRTNNLEKCRINQIENNYKLPWLFIVGMILLVIVVLSYKVSIIGFDNTPFLMLLSGYDFKELNATKGLILKNDFDTRIPYFDNIYLFILFFIPLYIQNYILSVGPSKMAKSLLVISSIISFFALIYDGAKSTVFYFFCNDDSKLYIL